MHPFRYGTRAAEQEAFRAFIVVRKEIGAVLSARKSAQLLRRKAVCAVQAYGKVKGFFGKRCAHKLSRKERAVPRAFDDRAFGAVAV